MDSASDEVAPPAAAGRRRGGARWLRRGPEWGEAGAAGPDDPSLHTVADELDAHLRDRYQESYAGIVVDDERGVLIIHRIPDRELEERVHAMRGGVKVELRDAAYSLADMESVASDIMADLDYWRDAGIDINGVAPRADGSGVVVSVADADDATGQRLQGAVPSGGDHGRAVDRGSADRKPSPADAGPFRWAAAKEPVAGGDGPRAVGTQNLSTAIAVV